ncbi:MAG: DUF1385 domain-containing protein [Dehalococcoidia bacterium]
MAKAPSYGGQAVVEGVMIRGQRTIAIACRRPDGTIALRAEGLGNLYTGPLRRWPLARGVIVLWETLVLGTKALLFSVNVAAGEEEEEIKGSSVWLMLALVLGVAAALFFAGPVFLSRWLEDRLGTSIAVVVVEGAIRLGIVLGYLYLIGLLPDVKRVFAYHGAEHKAINAYEAGAPLAVAAVQQHSKAHPRCGTSFLLTVVVVSVVVFAFLGTPPLWLRVVSRVALIPVIAAISYEVIRLGAAWQHHRLARFLFRPNLMLQTLTTRPSDDEQVAVAIQALQQALAADQGAEPSKTSHP